VSIRKKCNTSLCYEQKAQEKAEVGIVFADTCPFEKIDRVEALTLLRK
jgi:hypothetical protein